MIRGLQFIEEHYKERIPDMEAGKVPCPGYNVIAILRRAIHRKKDPISPEEAKKLKVEVFENGMTKIMLTAHLSRITPKTPGKSIKELEARIDELVAEVGRLTKKLDRLGKSAGGDRTAREPLAGPSKKAKKAGRRAAA